MFFIFPMWDSENERIGFSQCSPISAKLRSLAELGGYIGLFWLLGTIIFLIYKGIFGNFTSQLWWLLSYPFILGVINMFLFYLAYYIAAKKNYEYDAEKTQTTWIEAGKDKVYSNKT